MVKQLSKYQYLFFFIFVLFFRLFYATQVVNFTQDQARDIVLMQQMRDEHLILVGYGPKASVGNFYLAPFYYQLHYFLSFLTNNHPLTMHYFTTIVESLTPVLFLFILLKFVKKPVAYSAALLFAISPLITIFSTFAWNPNMIPFLSTLSLLMFLNYLKEGKFVQLLGGVLPIALAIHLHYQAIVLVPFVLLMMVLTIKKKNAFKHWLGAVFVSLSTLLPYFWAELNSNWHNTKQIFEFFTGEHSRYYDRISKPQFVLTFIPQFFERLFFKESFGWLKVGIGRLVFLFGFLLLAIRAIKNSQLRLIFVYFALILIMLRVYKGDKLDYYMSTLYIMPFFLLALLGEFKKIFLSLFFVVAWLAGGQLARVENNNQLKQLENMSHYLDQEIGVEQSAKFVFHDDNYKNIFSYGLRRYTSLKNDNNSTLIVDVCYGEQVCDWDATSWCKNDRGFTYMALFREATNYRGQTSYVTTNAYNVRIGRVDSLPDIRYQISDYDNSYGSDNIDSDWD